jgi:hypothetical protein
MRVCIPLDLSRLMFLGLSSHCLAFFVLVAGYLFSPLRYHEMTLIYPLTHTPQTTRNVIGVYSDVSCWCIRGIGSILSLRNLVPNIEQNYNLIPSEYLQIFLGIYV